MEHVLWEAVEFLHHSENGTVKEVAVGGVKWVRKLKVVACRAQVVGCVVVVRRRPGEKLLKVGVASVARKFVEDAQNGNVAS